MGVLEGLTKFVGGKRSRHSRRRRSRKHGGSGLTALNPAPVGGKKRRTHRKRSRSHKKRGGSPLVALGLLGSLLAMGPKKRRHSKKRRNSRK